MVVTAVKLIAAIASGERMDVGRNEKLDLRRSATHS